MKEYTVDEITKLTKEVNENRVKIYNTMGWKQKPPILTDSDVRIVLETKEAASNI